MEAIGTEIDIPPRAGRVTGAPGTKEWPGRNHPGIGAWLCSRFDPDVIADPMVGVGYLWSDIADRHRVLGCEKEEAGVAIARMNGIRAVCQRAEFWTPEEPPDLVAFSPIYPNANHNSGATPSQEEFVHQKRLHAAQKLTGTTNLMRVFLQIATYCGAAPVAVIVRNWINRKREVDWASEVEQSMRICGFEVERCYRRLLPGPFAQMKLKSGKQSVYVDREWVLVGRLERAG